MQSPQSGRAYSETQIVPRAQVGGSQRARVPCMSLLRSQRQSLDVNKLPFISRSPATLLAQRGGPEELKRDRTRPQFIFLGSRDWAAPSSFWQPRGSPRLRCERRSCSKLRSPTARPHHTPMTASPSEHTTPFPLTSLHHIQSSHSSIPSLPLSPFPHFTVK